MLVHLAHQAAPRALVGLERDLVSSTALERPALMPADGLERAEPVALRPGDAARLAMDPGLVHLMLDDLALVVAAFRPLHVPEEVREHAVAAVRALEGRAALVALAVGSHARKELRDTVRWPLETLRYELHYQRADGIHTRGPGRCGHVARGSGFCAKCLQAEIDRRTPPGEGG